MADQRRDGLHKLTTRLAEQYGTVVVENLHVAGMVRNRRLAKAISDRGFGEIRRQLHYKTVWRGGQHWDRPTQGGTVNQELTHAH